MDADGVYMEINTSTARYAVAQGNKQQQYVNVGPFSKQGNSKGVYANT